MSNNRNVHIAADEPSVGSTLLEAAAEQLNWTRCGVLDANDFRRVLQAIVRAAVGCDTCQGTGTVTETDPGATEREHLEGLSQIPAMCPDQCVELTILGETIWADPERCELHCTVHDNTTNGHDECQMSWMNDWDRSKCVVMWLPRIDLLLGGDDA